MIAHLHVKRPVLLFTALASLLPMAGHSKEAPIVLLAEAVRKGELKTVEKLLAEGVDPNQRVPGEPLRYTPLFLSVDGDLPEVTRALLKAGADPAIEDENGDPVMTMAADPAHPDQARILIAHGVSIDSKNRSGITALLRSAPYAESEEIRTLLDLGANPNQCTPRGDSALMLAVMNHKSATAEILIKAGAKVDEPNQLGESPLQVLLKNDNYGSEIELMTSIARLLIKSGADVNRRDAAGLTPLLHASSARSSMPDVMRVLLEARPDLAVRDEDGRDALFHVTFGNDQEPVRLLVDAGADVRTTDHENMDLLMVSARMSNPGQVRFFMEKGLTPKARDKHGSTAVHHASQNGRWADTEKERGEIAGRTVETLKLLESHGGSLIDPDGDGSTPLHLASLAGTAPVVAYLLEHCPAADPRDKDGDTPLHLAADSGATSVLELLTPKYPDIDTRNQDGSTALMLASYGGHEDAVLHLLKAGAKIDAADHEGDTAVSDALEREDIPHLRFLIEHGADPKLIKDPDKELLRAARRFHDQPVSPEDYSFLIGILAGLANDINSKDEAGLSVLIWTAASGNQAALETVLKFHPDLNQRGPDGRTALMWAAASQATGSMNLLRQAGADDLARDQAGRDSKDWLKWAQAPGSSSKVELPEGAPSLGERIRARQAEELRAYLLRDKWNAENRIAGMPPMHLAATLDDADAIATLLEKGLPPDQTTDGQTTPLMTAAAGGRLKAVEFLLNHGADPSLRDAAQNRAVDHAVDFKQKEIARLLLGKIDSFGSDETALLTSLIACDDKELLRDFLKAGASIPQQDKRIDDGPFSTSMASDQVVNSASSRDDPEFLKILAEFPAATGMDDPDYLSKALDIAADRGCLANMKYLVEDLDVKPDFMSDHTSGTAIELTSRSGSSDKLINKFTPLSRALENGHEEVVRYLVDRKVVITGRMASGAPPLVHVTQHRRHDLLELFLKHEADTSFVDFKGRTALHVAAEADDAVAVRLLLDHGADPNAKDQKGRTPLDLAKEKNANQTSLLLQPLVK